METLHFLQQEQLFNNNINKFNKEVELCNILNNYNINCILNQSLQIEKEQIHLSRKYLDELCIIISN